MTARVEAKLTSDTPVQYVRGVGAARAALLANAGIETVGDLLLDFPFRYEDRRHPVRIVDLRRIDAPVTLRGKIVSAARRTSPRKRMKIFEAILDDGTGTMMLVWFNQPYLSDQIHRGDQISVYGQPRISGAGRLQLESPDWEKIDDEDLEGEGKIVPVYSSVATITPKAMRRIVQQSLVAIDTVGDPLPQELRRRLGVIELQTALRELHSPSELTPDFLAARSPAHIRIILEEFFIFQLALQLRRASDEVESKERKIEIDDRVRSRVREILPFSLTRAQKRVLKEIAGDMQSGRPMYRLLQGDVGSGKTIVALISAIIAIENGHQAALLAPTEILAEQHYQRIRQLVDGMVRIAKLTGSTTAAERRPILKALRDGYLHLLIGTHAMLEDPVRFHSLGLAIVDEQHRFGVEQRQRLFAKSRLPDILVMTATPIPRSLALSMYGDLDLSIIDELPPGRQPVKTVARPTSQLPKVYDFLEGQIAAGAQAYIVYPVIEESEKLDLKPLKVGFEAVKKRFPGRNVAMLHGRMPAREKEETMEAFQKRKVDVLVSTTVIEVGVDVANASLMLIMDADRFGLSQLHQLRGRVGRGERKSYCVLLRDESVQEEAKERLRIFEQTRDGFEVAERDLQLRGAGDMLGTRQSGMPKFRFGDIVRDHRLMEQARDLAIGILHERGYEATVQLAGEVIPALAKATRKD